jgi:hypothetical protein
MGPEPQTAEPQCPTCGGTAAVTATTTGDTVTYRCAATYAHDDHQPRFWTVAKAQPRAARTPRAPRAPRSTSGAAARTSTRATAVATPAVDLGAPLLAVIESLPAMWIEHGVIEYRLRVDHPDVFGRQVAEAGHVLLRPGATRGTTASGLRFATALMRLEQEAAVTHVNAPSTGAAWEQDKVVGYWARRPKPPRDQVLTWEQYAVETLGRENGDWTDDDRVEVARLAAAYRP